MIKEFNVRCDFVLNQESDGNDAATSITLPEFVKGYNKYMFDVLNTGSMVIKDYDPNLVHNQYFICDASDNLQHSTSARDRADVIAALDEAGVPCGPINSIPEVFADPQVQSRGMLQHIPHPSGVDVPQVVSPMRFAGEALTFDIPPPLLGEHTDAILTRFGYDAERIARLREAGVL
jgi:crotonobetainyl-CoA:carnitine CoA-transferase CaiB-like acyl-CoA transferase